MRDNRKYERYDMMLEVEVIWPGHGSVTALTENVSDGGVLLQARFQPDQPPPGTVVNTRVSGPAGDGDPPLLNARVVRASPSVIALEFIRE